MYKTKKNEHRLPIFQLYPGAEKYLPKTATDELFPPYADKEDLEFMIDPGDLFFDFGNFEPFLCSIALFNITQKKKLSENFYFHLNDKPRVNLLNDPVCYFLLSFPIFSLPYFFFPLLSLPCLWFIPLSTWILLFFLLSNVSLCFPLFSPLPLIAYFPSPSLSLPPSCFILLPSIFLFSLSPFILSPHCLISLFLFPPPPLSSFFPFA